MFCLPLALRKLAIEPGFVYHLPSENLKWCHVSFITCPQKTCNRVMFRLPLALRKLCNRAMFRLPLALRKLAIEPCSIYTLAPLKTCNSTNVPFITGSPSDNLQWRHVPFITCPHKTCNGAMLRLSLALRKTCNGAMFLLSLAPRKLAMAPCSFYHLPPENLQ